MVGSPGSIYHSGWGVTNNCHLDTPASCQHMVDHIVPPGYFSELRHLPNDEFLNQYNTTLARKVAMGSQLRLRFEQKTKLLKKAVARVARRDQRIQAREKHTQNFKALLEVEADMKDIAEAKNVELVTKLESLRVFVDVVSAVISKGMSERLKHGVEHEKAKIPVYPEVRNPKDPWSFKEEILLEDAITVNISHAKKKKKCQVVCHTHRVGSAHHARSDGIPVSVPTVAPQGLAILLVDAATQTYITKDEASLKLLRFKSLPPMYNLDWP
nr:hypothetical protein [Tanacetum cinerariifolium]